MDVGRRQRIPGSETKDFITHSTPASLNCMFPLVTHVFQVLQESQLQTQMNAMHVVFQFHSLKTLSLNNASLIKDFKQTCSAFAPEGDIVFIEQQTYLHSARDKNVLSLCEGYLLYKYPYKDGLEQNLSGSLLTRFT